MKITIDTDVPGTCQPCQIVCEDGRSILPSTDFDYPAYASTFGWNMQDVQKCPCCHEISTSRIEQPAGAEREQQYCDTGIKDDEDCRVYTFMRCSHDSTDGTVDCKECNVTVSEFISSARTFLELNDGLTVEDPGYFDEENE